MLNENSKVEIGSFDVMQNNPNLFNSSTKIDYYVKESGMVILKIYDINWMLIRKLVDTEQLSGNCRVVWDGSNDNSKKVA